MQRIAIISTLVLLACGSKKNTVTPSNEMHLRAVGIVQLQEGTCPITIEVQSPERTVKYQPDNLPEHFQRNGMRLRFNFREIAKDKGNNCEFATIHLEEVTPLR